MTQAWALFKKEIMEFSRNYKLLIVVSVFLLFGFLNPLSAKFLPEVLSSVLPKEVAESFPAPTAFDSWVQFFKNISQLGLFVIVLVFGSILSSERQSGTLIILLTKGLPRQTVLHVKASFAMLVWTASYCLTFIITFAYTQYYWPDNAVTQLFLALFLLWLFGIFLIEIIVLGNVLFRSFFSTLLFTAVVLVLLFIISIFPKLEKISIIRLALDNNAVLHGSFTWSDFGYPIALTIILILSLHTLAVTLFNRKSL